MREEICYEMIYQVQETSRKVTVGMAVETELVLKECGKLLGQTIHALDAMTLSMVEELSQQLVGRLDHLLMPEEHKSILVKKGFLSSDQFNKQLEHKMPEYSILFAAGDGRVALCIDSSVVPNV